MFTGVCMLRIRSGVLSTEGESACLSPLSVSARVSGTGDGAMLEMSGTMARVSRILSRSDRENTP